MKPLPLALFALTLTAQSGPDPNGWQSITWQMSLAEARAALDPSASCPVDPPGSPAIELIDRLCTRVQLAGDSVPAYIQTARSSNHIAAITIRAADIGDPHQEATYLELKRLLLEKYAAPKDEHTTRSANGMVESTALWTFPHTSITLTRYYDPRESTLSLITIRYRPVTPSPL